MSTLQIILLVLGVISTIIVALRLFHIHSTILFNKTLKEFEIAFPNECFYCSFYRHARREGMWKSDQPIPHHEHYKEQANKLAALAGRDRAHE